MEEQEDKANIWFNIGGLTVPPFAIVLSLYLSISVEHIHLPIGNLSLSDVVAISCLFSEAFGFIVAFCVSFRGSSHKIKSIAEWTAVGFILGFIAQLLFSPIYISLMR